MSMHVEVIVILIIPREMESGLRTVPVQLYAAASGGSVLHTVIYGRGSLWAPTAAAVGLPRLRRVAKART